MKPTIDTSLRDVPHITHELKDQGSSDTKTSPHPEEQTLNLFNFLVREHLVLIPHFVSPQY